MKTRWLVLSLALAAVAAVAAVAFSSQPGVTSHGVSRGIITWFLDLFQMKISEEAMGWCNFFLRRGAHLLIYCVLGAGLSGLFYLQKKIPPWIPAMMLGESCSRPPMSITSFSRGTALPHRKMCSWTPAEWRWAVFSPMWLFES